MNFALFLPIICSVLSSLGLGAISIPFLIILVIIGLIIIILIKLFLILIPAIIVAASCISLLVVTCFGLALLS